MLLNDVSYLLRDFDKKNWKDCPTCLPESKCGYVYAVVLNDEGSNRFPIYVGQCESIRRRVGDYDQAYFSAPTDFKVGQAIRYFCANGFDVEIWFKASPTCMADERPTIVDLLINGYVLLNSLPGYDYTVADREQQWHNVAAHCYLIVAQTVWRTRGSQLVNWGKPDMRMIGSVEPKEAS